MPGALRDRPALGDLVVLAFFWHWRDVEGSGAVRQRKAHAHRGMRAVLQQLRAETLSGSHDARIAAA